MSMTVDEIVVELDQMLTVSRGNTSLADRLGHGNLTVLYEFLVPDAEPVPYLLTVGRDVRSIEPGAVPYDKADIVIRAEPTTLHRLTSGDLSGREAIVGGLLDIRKAPSLPKLLQMRALFNRYKKALHRGEVFAPTDEDGDLSPVNCAVDAHLSGTRNTDARA
jgi:hypothetical protein